MFQTAPTRAACLRASSERPPRPSPRPCAGARPIGCPARELSALLASGYADDTPGIPSYTSFLTWFSTLTEEDFVYRFSATPSDTEVLTRRAATLVPPDRTLTASGGHRRAFLRRGAEKPSYPRIPSDRLGRSQIKLIKIGGRSVRHASRLVFQLAEVAVCREVFRQVLGHIGGLYPAPRQRSSLMSLRIRRDLGEGVPAVGGPFLFPMYRALGAVHVLGIGG